jgi:hypothetical protein
MGRRRLQSVGVLTVALGATIATTSVTVAMPVRSPGCSQFQALKRVFPHASAIGFTAREPVTRGALRAPVWPGTCAKWFTRYRRGSDEIEVSLTLYRTHKQALVALAEPSLGPVEVLPNGALARRGSSPTSTNGVAAQFAGIVSVYRNVFISSLSIAHNPVRLATQMRLHRGIHARVLGLAR